MKQEGTHAAGTTPDRFPRPMLPHKLLNIQLAIFNFGIYTSHSTKYMGVEK